MRRGVLGRAALQGARQFHSKSFGDDVAARPIDKSALAINMRKVREYINHRAHHGSIILGASNPILPTHRSIQDAGAAAWYDDMDIYTDVAERHQQKGNTMRYYSSRSDRGIKVLRDSLLQYCESKNFNTDKIGFFVTNSILSSIVPAFCNAMLKEGDKVLLTNPTYGPFFSTLHRRKTDIQLTNLDSDTKWKITPSILQKMLTDSPNAKMFLLINPGNPLGEVYSKEELTELAKIFVEHNKRRPEGDKLIIFSDEVARNVVLSDKEFVSIGSLPGMGDFTYTCWSLSKDVGGPGLGFAVGIGPEWLVEKVRIDDAGPAYVTQVAASKAFALDNQNQILEHCQKSNEIYRINIKLVTGLFEELNYKLNRKLFSSNAYSNLVFPTVFPEGGFQLAFHAAGLSGLEFPESYQHHPHKSQRNITNSLDLAWYLRESAKVEFIPGEGFGFLGKQMMFRMTIGKRAETLEDAFSRVTKSLLELSIDKSHDPKESTDQTPPNSSTKAVAKNTLSNNKSGRTPECC